MKMKTPLSPSDIEVLLHCHTCPAPHPRHDAPAVIESIDMFFQAGMILPTPTRSFTFTTTPKGNAFIQALLNTPEPVQSWSVPAKGECP